MTNTAVTLHNVSKEYIIHHEKPTLVEKVIFPPNERFWALKNINLTLKRGENVGVIGQNGSGKTTLLKIICGITTPTGGSVSTFGKIVSLLDLDAGFHADLNGLENIYLNGLLVGMSMAQISQKISQIIRFAQIGNFIDAPLFTYSLGMKLRLGFAIAVHADPDILILDEGVAVGDEKFQKKSKEKIRELINMHTTIITVSHWLDYLAHNCHRIIVMNKGQIIADGDKKIIDLYRAGKI